MLFITQFSFMICWSVIQAQNNDYVLRPKNESYVPYYQKGYDCQTYLRDHKDFCATLFDAGNRFTIPKKLPVTQM